MNGARDLFGVFVNVLSGALLATWAGSLVMWLNWYFYGIGLNQPAARVVTAGIIAVMLVCLLPEVALRIVRRDRLIFSYDREYKRLLRRGRVIGVAMGLIYVSILNFV
ncbi:hypothetical protein [Burkholderia ubonensis]|uniref:hypothetical protein n=1 Tax=Burkholderia ubonensis TaxID=101571 RepID=UPI0012F8499A|nr:hypothetical protein [Burkholderia ubonensis]